MTASDFHTNLWIPTLFVISLDYVKVPQVAGVESLRVLTSFAYLKQGLNKKEVLYPQSIKNTALAAFICYRGQKSSQNY